MQNKRRKKVVMPGQGALTAMNEAATAALTAVNQFRSLLGVDPGEVERLQDQVQKLEDQVEALQRSETRLEAALSEYEGSADKLPDGVASLRDGTYETDEKIRLFASRISKRPLIELERMF